MALTMPTAGPSFGTRCQTTRLRGLGRYGEASPQEAKELLDEGVELHPLPVLPEERN